MGRKHVDRRVVAFIEGCGAVLQNDQELLDTLLGRLSLIADGKGPLLGIAESRTLCVRMLEARAQLVVQLGQIGALTRDLVPKRRVM
jgi:hypothetical protein